MIFLFLSHYTIDSPAPSQLINVTGISIIGGIATACDTLFSQVRINSIHVYPLHKYKKGIKTACCGYSRSANLKNEAY